MENEERKEEMNENIKEDIKVVEGTIIGNSENTKNNAKDIKKDGEVSNKKGLCIASLVLGIVSLVFCCMYEISIPCAILALVFGIIGIKSEGKGMATAGIITGAISLVIMIFFFIICFITGFAIGLNQVLNGDYSYYDDDDYSYNTTYDRFYDKYDL